ncbi:MAG: voltage-gated potassium channel [Sulfurimonas sp.]|jgi:voltage-gated potassium channel|uniref:potassium transporter TrkA n=1 Tax=Sulfurimonas sp. TaxID=2022749 RepID=UPI0039E3F19A
MKENTALIFGRNEYTFEIEKNIASEYKSIYTFTLAEDGDDSFDLSDNWDDLRKKVDIHDCTAFCILENIAENIFLTISLRDTFKDLTIIALSNDIESTDKLMLAGATRVLPSIETTANVIVEMLEKPIVTEVLHNILYEKSDLKIAQIKIEDDSFFDGKYPTDIEWSRDHGIIVISVVHEDNSREFIYSSKAQHHIVQSGDIFVVVGYDTDIKEFQRLIGSKCEN